MGPLTVDTCDRAKDRAPAISPTDELHSASRAYADASAAYWSGFRQAPEDRARLNALGDARGVLLAAALKFAMATGQ